MKLAPDAERILEDFSHSHKLGEISTHRLLTLLVEVCRSVDAIREDLRYLKGETKRTPR